MVAAAGRDGSVQPSHHEESSQADASKILAETQESGDNNAPNGTGVKQSESSSSTEPVRFEAAVAFSRVLAIAGSVVANTTLLTALLFYFGLVYAIGFFQYFGVNFTVLNLPVQDYLVLSIDGLVIPLIYVAGVALLSLWLYQLRLETLSVRARHIAQHVIMPSSALAGLVLVSLAMAHAVFVIPVFPTTVPEARGLSLSIGVLLLAYAARLRRVLTEERKPGQIPQLVPDAVVVAKWGAVFILLSIGLFWAVGSYAIGVGEGQAQALAADLPYSPDVVLYSEKSLSLKAPGIREATCQNPDAAYRFRYEGLRLVPQSGNYYLFIPTGWTPAMGAAILIPRTQTMRLEFSWKNQIRNGTC